MSGNERGSAATTFLAAVAAFAVGIGAGWLLFASDSEPGDPAPSPAPAAAPSEGSAPAAAPRRGRTGEGAGRTDAAGERTISAAVASPVDLPPLAGTGVIRGSVKSDAGLPLDSVEIRAYAYTPPEWNAEFRGRTWDEIPVDEALRRIVRERRWWEASKKTAVTGADGKFELTGLADVNWSIVARRDGFTFTAQRGGADPARVGAAVEFVGSESVRIDLDVRLADGTKPPRASLDWTRGDSNNTTRDDWWPGREFVEMKPGRWRLTVTGGEDQRCAAPPFDVDVRAGMAPVAVTLKERPGVIVSAKRPDGFAGLGLRFFAVRAEGAEPSDDDLRGTKTTRDLMHLRFPDDSEGDRRCFLDLAPGRWLVATGFDGAPLARRTVAVTDRIVEFELVVPAPDMSQFVEVHVAGADGAALTSVRFDWEYRAEREKASYSAAAIARGPGVWLVRRVGPGDRPHSSQRSGARDTNGTWHLTVASDGFGSEETALAAGAVRADVRLAAPAVAVVSVTGLPPGAAGTRFTVGLSRDGHHASDVPVAADGSAKLRPVKAAQYTLALTVQVGEWSSLEIVKRKVDLVVGENAVEIAAPALHPLDIDLGADEAGGTCFLNYVADDESTDFIHVELDAAGRAKLDLVPAGRYRVNADGKNHEFRVPETRTFKLP